MSRRKSRKAAEQPVQAPAAAPGTEPAMDEIRALRERLDRVEKDQSPRDAWAMVADRHRIEREREIAAHTRVSPDTPCQACGDAEAVQRRLVSPLVLGASGWICDPCMQAVQPGWGTQSTRTLNRSQGVDRLACLAAGLAEFTEGFAVLASRYGLTFQLAQDSRGDGDGTAWSHLSDLAEWRRVGELAVRRHAAGFGVFPVATLPTPPEKRLGRVWDRKAGAVRLGLVEEAPEPPAPGELAAQLAAEETAIAQTLKDRKRAAKEAEAAAAETARQAEVRRHWRDHQRQLEREIKRQRAALRQDLRTALGRGGAA
ncbi:hypothetical protein OG741_19315 [Streptomyces sp. NBC_01410]|uniref:hypothetical protein n=1 Tax=Streptomyces sp. NBC_01410 TaxID=2903856 RepID=UPI00325444C4